MRTKFVEPKPYTLEDEAIAHFRGKWRDTEQAKWLAPIVVKTKPLRREIADSVEQSMRAVRILLRQLEGGGDPQLAIIRFIASHLREHEVDPARDELITALRAHQYDFDAAFGRYEPRHGFNPTREEAARLLRGASLVNIARIIDWARQVERGRSPFIHESNNWGSSSPGWMDADDPTSLSFWLRCDFNAAVEAVEQRERASDDADEIICLEKSLHQAVFWRNARESHHHHENYALALGDLAASLRKHHAFFRELILAKGIMAKHPRVPELVLRLRFVAWEGDEAALSDDVHKDEVAMANRELGALRSRLAALPVEEQHELLLEQREHLLACSRALFTGGGLWAGMKALLLLIRALKGPAFEPDLSWWGSYKDSKRARGVVRLAHDLMFGFQTFARTEQEDDPKLVELRTDLARFCVERLSTRKDKSGPTEPDATWRYGYVRALGELGVNPDGKGHQTLHHVMNDDADAEVRAAAQKVYPRLREQRAAPEGNPRRAMLAALWWIRQAQMISVGVDVDADGANRTRAEEVRYTARSRRLD